MWPVVLFYGLISGIILISSSLFGSLGSPLPGYLIMLVALSPVFLGAKRYRDRKHSGALTFGAALLVSLSIALVASFVYVFLWETYLVATDYSFSAKYIEGLEEQRIAEGIVDKALNAEITRLVAAEVRLADPWFRIPVTFFEVFPGGAFVAVVSAILLRDPKIVSAAD